MITALFLEPFPPGGRRHEGARAPNGAVSG